MNTSAKMVTVYSFRRMDRGTESSDVAPFKASREDIVSRYGGEVLEGTAEVVDMAALDSDSRYRRLATGWGELA